MASCRLLVTKVVFVLVLLKVIYGRNDRHVWKHRFKRSGEDQNNDRIDNFDSDNLDKYFPESKYIRTEISLQDASKRSRVPELLQDFSNTNEGSLVVIDTDKNMEETFHKKSDVNRVKQDSKGLSIVLNSNGMNENEAKKDEILHEMENGSVEMEEQFADFIKNPIKHKKLRVILITPVKSHQGYERDNLPQPDDFSLDNLAEVHRGNLVLSENEGRDATEQLLSDSKRKSELEIDIDKLKHVKEKLKLLNEDDVHDESSAASKMSLSNHPVPEEIKTSPEITKSFSAKSNKTEDAKTNLLKISNNLTTAEHVIDMIRKNTTSLSRFNESKGDFLMHEVKEVKSNKNVHLQTDDKSNSTVQKVSDDNGDQNNRKHEISNKSMQIFSNVLIHNIRKPPGNPSPEDSSDLMSQQIFENPTKSSKINIPDPEISKKEKTHQQISELSSDSVVASKHESSSDLTSNDVIKSKSKSVVIQPTIHPPTLRSDDTAINSKLVKNFSKGLNSTDISKDNNNSSETDNKNENEDKTKKVTKTKKDFSMPDAHLEIESKVEMSHLQSTKNSFHEKFNYVKQSTPSFTPAPTSSLFPQARIIDKRKAEAIIEFMNKDPLETWRYRFNTLKSLDLNSTILRSGLVNAGNIERLKGVMRRALEGKDITISVVGGSISAGGGLYKDRGNIEGLYYKGVVDWWNKMISPITGSDMVVNNIAIGSIGTDYFSYCIKNHIVNETDIVLWELSANDYNRYKTQATKGARPLERLTRQILLMPNKPALLYVNFFKGIDYKNSKISCPDFEDQGEDIIAHYYKIPSLSWRAMVCNGLIHGESGYSIETLFSNDQYHPSLRGHAQMSLLLLLHLRHVMRAVLQWAISHEGYIQRFEDNSDLPDPLFMGPKYPFPLCWTLITADLRDKISNSLTVKVVKDIGFKLEYATNFPIRFDKVICWKAEFPSAELVLQFEIPKYYESSQRTERTKSRVIITTHTRFGGSSSLWIDDREHQAVIIKEGRTNDPGKRTQVDYVSDDIGYGTHFLHVRSIDGGFCLASLMVDDG